MDLLVIARLAVALLAASPANTTSAAAATPSPLAVSENGRALIDAQGRPVFLLADTAWDLSERVKREEIAAYLETRRSQRFSAVAFVAVHPSTEKNVYGDRPFERASGRLDPTRPITTAAADPARPAEYDYWDHLDFTIDECGRRGLYAIVLPCWGDGVTGSYNGQSRDKAIFNADSAQRYGQWIGRRYRQRHHIVWMLGGDVAGAYPGGNDYTAVFRAMAKGLRQGLGPGHDALLSFHPQKVNPRSAAWFHGDDWLSFNSIQAWPDDQIECITADWNLSPPKPTWIFEGRYEAYWKSNYRPEQWGAWQCRQQAYQTVLAGGFGHTYGHERIFGFGADDWDWQKELRSPGAQSMTQLARLIDWLGGDYLVTRLPEQAIVVGDSGTAGRLESNRVTASSGVGQRRAVFYTANGRDIDVRMDRLAQGTLDAYWFNPRSGRWHTGGSESADAQPAGQPLPSGRGAAPHRFNPPGTPGPDNDWVLVLAPHAAPAAAH